MARIDVIMPQMGESIAEGTLSRWMKKVGEEVKRDETIFEISTDKVDAEIPAPGAGVLAEILVTEGQTVPVQTVVARIETEKGAATAAPAPEPVKAAAAPAPAAVDVAPTIGIDDFAKLDLRVGKVVACEFVEGSDKLLRFELDAGELGTRQIFSGIRGSYGEPEKLVGRSVVFIANLAPRKMRFGISEGMILSAGFDGGSLHLLDADAGVQPGAPVR